MANNDQWLFENMSRIRYNNAGLIKDTSLKVIAGKTPYAANNTEEQNVSVYFGSFFTAGCKPVVVCTAEQVARQAILVEINGLSGELDYRGFNAHIQDRDAIGLGGWGIRNSGWVHWIAVGY